MYVGWSLYVDLLRPNLEILVFSSFSYVWMVDFLVDFAIKCLVSRYYLSRTAFTVRKFVMRFTPWFISNTNDTQVHTLLWVGIVKLQLWMFRKSTDCKNEYLISITLLRRQFSLPLLSIPSYFYSRVEISRLKCLMNNFKCD